LRQVFEQIGRQAKLKVVPRLPYAAVGAGVGAGVGGVESQMSNEPLRKGVAELEAKPDRGYKDTLSLAQKRARLTIGEFAQAHPGTTVGLGALSGAALGYQKGPELVASLRRSGEHLKGIRDEMRSQKGAA
jgi:hypothetical protein